MFSFIDIDNTIAEDGSYGFSKEDNRPGDVHLVESDGELFMVTLCPGGTRSAEPASTGWTLRRSGGER